jgi:hypothetical protein
VLDEQIRLGVAEERDGLCRLVQSGSFLPVRDLEEMARQLSANVGDHLAAAAANFCAARRSEKSPYLEFALWADELSAQSVTELQQLAQAQWMAAMKTVRNVAQARSAEDAAALPASELHRFRFGVYIYHAPGYEPLAGEPASEASAPQSPGKTS